MELRQLRYFLAVAEELHFGRAAARLRMSQPPLSVHVSRLEQELGTPLLERTTRSVVLTPAGRHLQNRAQVIFDDIDTMLDEMRGFATGLSGQLAVGFVSSANYTVLPAVVRLFRAARPKVTLQLSPLTSGEQLDLLRNGKLDIGIVRDEVPADVESGIAMRAEVVFEEPLVACLPSDHPFADRPEVTADEIVSVPMISYPRSLMPGYVDRVATVLHTVPTLVRVVEEVVHQETALGFVAAGAGTSILPNSVRHLLPPSIVAVPLAGSPKSQLLAVRREHPDRPAAAAFVSCLHEASQLIGDTSVH